MGSFKAEVLNFNTKLKQQQQQQKHNTDLVILVLKTLQGFYISFIAKFLAITHTDIADLGPYNFSDFISYDRSPCPLCCRHTDLYFLNLGSPLLGKLARNPHSLLLHFNLLCYFLSESFPGILFRKSAPYTDISCPLLHFCTP